MLSIHDARTRGYTCKIYPNAEKIGILSLHIKRKQQLNDQAGF